MTPRISGTFQRKLDGMGYYVLSLMSVMNLAMVKRLKHLMKVLGEAPGVKTSGRPEGELNRNDDDLGRLFKRRRKRQKRSGGSDDLQRDLAQLG